MRLRRYEIHFLLIRGDERLNMSLQVLKKNQEGNTSVSKLFS